MSTSSAGQGPKISMIIPGWNENQNILNCIKSLKRQTYHNFNIFMILGGQDKKIIEKAKNLGWSQLIVLDQIEPNKMKAYNIAIEHSDLGDILVFSDMDCEFPENFLNLYIDAFADKEKNILTGRVCPDHRGKSFIDRYHRNFEEKIAPKTAKIIKSIVGANFAVRKRFFLNIFDRFDETIAIGTDKAITKRMNEISEPIYFDPAIIVYTKFFSAGLIKYFKQQTRWIRIRVLRNRKSNKKAFRLSLMALLIPWLMCFIFPISILLSKHIFEDRFLWGWYFVIYAWIVLLIHSWLKRYKILRGVKGKLLDDAMAASCMLMIHYSINMIASLQLLFKKYRFRW